MRTRVPGISEELADQVERIVRSLRTLELRKAPSVSETAGLGPQHLRDPGGGDDDRRRRSARDTLHILLKYQGDIRRARQELLSAS